MVAVQDLTIEVKEHTSTIEDDSRFPEKSIRNLIFIVCPIFLWDGVFHIQVLRR